MEQKNALGAEYPVNFEELASRVVQMFDNHVGCDQVKGLILKWQLCDIAAENLDFSAQSTYPALVLHLERKTGVMECWSIEEKKINTPLLKHSISPLLTARADQFSTIHPAAACTETGRANG